METSTKKATAIEPAQAGTEIDRLGICPACHAVVVANAYAVRYRGGWFHINCALGCEHRAISRRSA